MITFITLYTVWVIISFYRVYVKSKEQGLPFNPFNGNFIEYLGVVSGTGALIVLGLVLVIGLTFYFLP